MAQSSCALSDSQTRQSRSTVQSHQLPPNRRTLSSPRGTKRVAAAVAISLDEIASMTRAQPAQAIQSLDEPSGKAQLEILGQSEQLDILNLP